MWWFAPREGSEKYVKSCWWLSHTSAQMCPVFAAWASRKSSLLDCAAAKIHNKEFLCLFGITALFCLAVSVENKHTVRRSEQCTGRTVSTGRCEMYVERTVLWKLSPMTVEHSEFHKLIENHQSQDKQNMARYSPRWWQEEGLGHSICVKNNNTNT